MARSSTQLNKKPVFLIVLCCLTVFAYKSSSQPVLALEMPVISGLSAPIELDTAGDGSGRVFIVQQGGTIRVYNAAFSPLGTPNNFLTVSNVGTGGERGLLSMAFHPDYETNGFFYVYYTNLAGDLELARYHATGLSNTAESGSKVIVLTIPHPGESNHNGGTLNFGNDGYLYFATGDGGGGGDVPNNAQNGNSLLGKMLRIAVNTSPTAPYYTIPADNPYVGNPAILDEIWALGLRNPFRWSFDKLTYDMWIADVGQGAWEEINYRAAGSTGGINYGWRCYEGNAAFNTSGCGPMNSYVFPVHVYPNGPGSAAVTGGTVYRGSVYTPLQGYYLAADFYSGNVYKIRPNGAGGWSVFTQNLQTGIADFGVTENGEIYTVSLTAGTVSHLIVTGVLPVGLISFTGTLRNNLVELKWKTSYEQNLRQFEVEYSTDGTNYTQIGIVPAQNLFNGADYQFNHNISFSGLIYYRLRTVDISGSFQYSNVITVTVNTRDGNFIYPSVINNGTMTIYLTEPFNSLELIAMNGAVVLQKDMNGLAGRIDIPVHKPAAGLYVAILRKAEKRLLQKIFIR